jgi:dihydroorotase-like cyclic amidohydrolase
MLSQLSYAPRRQSDHSVHHKRENANQIAKVRVGLPWLEQGTSVLSGLRSNQLSYRPAGDAPRTNPATAEE